MCQSEMHPGSSWLTFHYPRIFNGKCVSSKYKAVLEGRGFKPYFPIDPFITGNASRLLAQKMGSFKHFGKMNIVETKLATVSGLSCISIGSSKLHEDKASPSFCPTIPNAQRHLGAILSQDDVNLLSKFNAVSLSTRFATQVSRSRKSEVCRQ